MSDGLTGAMDYWGSIGIATLVFAVLGVIFTFIPFMKDRGFVVVFCRLLCLCVLFFVDVFSFWCVCVCSADSAASLCGRRSCACGSCGSARTRRRSTHLATPSSRRLPTTSRRNKRGRPSLFPLFNPSSFSLHPCTPPFFPIHILSLHGHLRCPLFPLQQAPFLLCVCVFFSPWWVRLIGRS